MFINYEKDHMVFIPLGLDSTLCSVIAQTQCFFAGLLDEKHKQFRVSQIVEPVRNLNAERRLLYYS